MTTEEKDLLTKLLTSLDIDDNQIIITEGDTITIDIAAEEDQKGILIGRHAQTLDSLQLILSLMLNNQKEDHQRILLDISDYRKQRFLKIMDIADQVASSVTQTGEPKALPRLSPTERRQVHTHFSDNEKLTTFSQGEGQDRRLFISPTSE